jgi:hypothetical protein
MEQKKNNKTKVAFASFLIWAAATAGIEAGFIFNHNNINNSQEGIALERYGEKIDAKTNKDAAYAITDEYLYNEKDVKIDVEEIGLLGPFGFEGKLNPIYTNIERIVKYDDLHCVPVINGSQEYNNIITERNLLVDSLVNHQVILFKM